MLTAYIEWGEKCVDHLNGIFAFAVWDEHKKQLFMARDRLGVKPLFYHNENGSLLFGSEIKAILAHPKMKAEIDREGLREIFGLGPSEPLVMVYLEGFANFVQHMHASLIKTVLNNGAIGM